MDSDDYFPNIYLLVTYTWPIINIVIAFLFTLILLIISGWTAAGERALFSLTIDEITEIREEKDTKDKFIRQLLDRPLQTRTAIGLMQIILVVSLTICCFHGLHTLWAYFDSASGCILGIIICSLLLFAFCGIMPKMLIKKSSLSFARHSAAYLKTIDWLFRHFSKQMSSTTVVSQKEESANNESAIIAKEQTDEKEMLDEIVHFYNKTADEIMVPRLDMKSIDIKCGFQEALEIIIQSGFSRIPIYEETEDNIKGVLYAKDLLLYIQKSTDFEWQKLIRPAYFVPETKKIEDLLEEFRTNKVHIAIVVDEFGCTSGLVTMEDIIEEIVGDISDEYDTDEKQFVELPDGSYIFEGKIQLNDFFRETDIDENEFGDMIEDVETLAGLLLKIKGTLPHRRDIIEFHSYRFRVLEADERRVLKVKFARLSAPKQNAE